MKQLKYTKGVAVICLREQEVFSEYHCDSSKRYVEIRMKSQAAVKRIYEITDEWTMDKNTRDSLILRLKRGSEYVVHECYIESDILSLYYPTWYYQKGYTLDYRNSYTDEQYNINIPVTTAGLKEAKQNLLFANLYKKASYGSCADGGSLKNLIDRMVKTKNVIK